MKSYVVIGLGRFGSQAARELCRMGNEVLAIDVQDDVVQQIAPFVTQAVVADVEDKEVLRSLGVRDFDCAIVGIGDNLATSVLATMNLKELGIPYVVCKAYDETHRRVLEKLGADRVIIPEKEMADKLARSLTSPNLLEYIELSGAYSIAEIPVPKKWVGKTVVKVNVRVNFGVNIIAVERKGELTVALTADFLFEDGDILILLGDHPSLDAVQKL